jgi:hypothetical protein
VSVENIVVKIAIPKGVAFSDLKLNWDSGKGDVVFDWTPIEAICKASGIETVVYRDAPRDGVLGLIASWYQAHLKHGGEHDEVADELFAEDDA